MISILSQRPVIKRQQTGRLVNFITLLLNSHFTICLCGSGLLACSFWYHQNLLSWSPRAVSVQAVLCPEGWVPAITPQLLHRALLSTQREHVVEALVSLNQREKASGLEDTQTFRTVAPLSNDLINGALVTCKR